MTRLTFTILDSHVEQLRRTLLRDKNEYGALLLCGRSQQIDPWTGEVEERVMVSEVVEMEPEAFTNRTPTSLEWSTTPLYHLSKRASFSDSAVVVAHSHPLGGLYFSAADDIADREAMAIVFNRVERSRPHYTLVMDDSGAFIVRAFDEQLSPLKVDLIRVIGDRIRLQYEGDASAASAALNRQSLAFGMKSTDDLRKLRVGIVGCGGTGSAVALLLSRLGIAHIVLFDADHVDETNLGRLHFSKRTDSVLMRLKVDVIAEGIAKIGVVKSIVGIASAVDNDDAKAAIRACDVVFGCTDDHLGRNFLNRLAHFYLIPVIDLGLLIEPNDVGGYDVFDGRVTVVQPGYPCQSCRGLISAQAMLEESLQRHDPALFELHRRAGYIRGNFEPNPAVVTFTTEVATMAVNELFHRLIGFRGAANCSERVRCFTDLKDSDLLAAGRSVPGCKLCDKRKYDGRGDMEPFMDMVS